jgi:Zn-dependent peptidase ImmA (M78 family)/DNA-binding XRE family transcriptional regulator
MMETIDTFLGYKLRIMRNFFGYSLEEIGERVEATRQYIQQLESNAKVPSEEMVLALSDVLEVKRDFFFTAENTLTTEDQCHFRSPRTTPSSNKNQAISQANVLDSVVREFDDILDFPAINLPSSTPKNLMDIERIAEEAREFWGLGTAAPITHMIRVVENAGVIVAHFKGVSEKVDAFSMSGRRPIILRNPSKESACRLRFDIGHECGHLIMHLGLITGDKKTEDEANRFASAFLLPRGAFIKEFPKRASFDWSAIYNMKLRWGVAVSTIVRRAYDLDLIDSVSYRRAYIHLSKSGQLKHERYDDQMTLEEPELIHTAIKTIGEDDPFLFDQVCDNLKIRRSILERLFNRELPRPAEEYGENVVSIRR